MKIAPAAKRILASFLALGSIPTSLAAAALPNADVRMDVSHSLGSPQKFAEAAALGDRVTAPEGFEKSTFGFTIIDGADSYVLQTTGTKCKPEVLPFAAASASACLPKAMPQCHGAE